MNPWPVEADGPRGAPPAPRPRRPRRRLEVRLHRRPQRARARERARDRRARGRRRAGQGVPARGRRRGRLARDADRLGARARSATAWRSRTSPASTSRRSAASTPTRRARWSRRSTCCASATSRSAASSSCARSGSSPASARTSRGRSGWTAGSAWRCSRSRRSRASGSATASTSPAAPAPRPTTRSSTTTQRGYYRETNRSGGLEGGMTTGEPLIVRCAMKPLPTLTKPLRSVDIATREPAQALRERTDSVVVPAAGVVGEAMLAIVLAGAYRREVRRRPHRRRARRARRLRRAHRVEAPRPARRAGARSSSSASWGRARRRRRARRPAALGARAVDSDHVLEERLGSRSTTASPRTARPRSARPRRSSSCELLDAPPAPVLSLGGGAVASERVREALARHTVVLLDVDAETAWQRAGGRAAARARPRALRRRCTRESPRRSTSGSPTRCCPTPRATSVRRAVPGAARARAAPAGTRLLWARSASGDYPVLRRATGCSAARRARPPAGAFLVTDDTVGALYADARRATSRPTFAIPPGEEAKTWEQAGARAARARRRRDGGRRPRARARRRRGRRPRRLLRRDLPARRAGRAGADDARRAGRLRLRRQDRRRPAGGQELRRRLPPAGGRAGRPGACWRRSRRRSSRRAGPRWSRPR